MFWGGWCLNSAQFWCSTYIILLSLRNKILAHCTKQCNGEPDQEHRVSPMLEYNNVTQCMETVLQQYSAVSTQEDDPCVVRFPNPLASGIHVSWWTLRCSTVQRMIHAGKNNPWSWFWRVSLRAAGFAAGNHHHLFWQSQLVSDVNKHFGWLFGSWQLNDNDEVGFLVIANVNDDYDEGTSLTMILN